MGPSTLASWALLLAHALEERNIDASELFRRAGLPFERLRDPNARYPVGAMQRLWTLAADASGDPCFGLEVGRKWHPTSFHALGYAVLACSTLREALVYVVRYCRLVSTGAAVELVDSGTSVTARLTRGVSDGEARAHWVKPSVQAALAATAVLCRATAGREVAFGQVSFRDPDARGSARLEQFFECPVHFGASHDAIVFDTQVLDHVLATGHPVLLRINEQALHDYMAQVESQDIVDQVRSRITQALPSGEVKQTAVARSLHLSLRTMQRKLNQQGTSFRELLDETRKRLAEQYARDSTVSQSEIAYLLGFSEASSLARAMGRWGKRTARAAA